MQTSTINLVADIGGTNARFGLVDGPDNLPYQVESYRCCDFKDLYSAVDAYIKSLSMPGPSQAVFSLATSIDSDQLSMTNNSWSFSVRNLCKSLDFNSLKVINDFTALSLALPGLKEDDYRQLGGGSSKADQPRAIIGPGTGLGISAIIKVGSQWWPIQGEGGHVSYGPLDTNEAEVVNVIRRQFGHVSAERLVSGPGILLLYRTICGLENQPIIATSPQEITSMALQKKCPVAERTLSMFCAILGSVAGNLALTLGAKGGVYVGGGIPPQLGQYFVQSDFRKRFEQHGRFTQYLEKIPTYVLQSTHLALKGAALALMPEYSDLGITSGKR